MNKEIKTAVEIAILLAIFLGVWHIFDFTMKSIVTENFTRAFGGFCLGFIGAWGYLIQTKL